MNDKQKKLRITLSKSVIGSLQYHRDTIKSLGLRKMHQSVERVDSPSLRGMIHQVKHLVTVEEVEE